MKPFNLELAKQGHPVCTRDGRPARIVCFDRKNASYPLVALVQIKDKVVTEDSYVYTDKGRYLNDVEDTGNDLFMVSKKKTGWINVYEDYDHYTAGNVYKSKQEAIDADSAGSRIDTIQIEFEV